MFCGLRRIGCCAPFTFVNFVLLAAIRAIAASGGVIGVSIYGPMCWDGDAGRHPSLDDFERHLDHIVQHRRLLAEQGREGRDQIGQVGRAVGVHTDHGGLVAVGASARQ